MNTNADIDGQLFALMGAITFDTNTVSPVRTVKGTGSYLPRSFCCVFISPRPTHVLP